MTAPAGDLRLEEEDLLAAGRVAAMLGRPPGGEPVACDRGDRGQASVDVRVLPTAGRLDDLELGGGWERAGTQSRQRVGDDRRRLMAVDPCDRVNRGLELGQALARDRRCGQRQEPGRRRAGQDAQAAATDDGVGIGERRVDRAGKLGRAEAGERLQHLHAARGFERRVGRRLRQERRDVGESVGGGDPQDVGTERTGRFEERRQGNADGGRRRRLVAGRERPAGAEHAVQSARRGPCLQARDRLPAERDGRVGAGGDPRHRGRLRAASDAEVGRDHTAPERLGVGGGPVGRRRAAVAADIGIAGRDLGQGRRERLDRLVVDAAGSLENDGRIGVVEAAGEERAAQAAQRDRHAEPDVHRRIGKKRLEPVGPVRGGRGEADAAMAGAASKRRDHGVPQLVVAGGGIAQAGRGVVAEHGHERRDRRRIAEPAEGLGREEPNPRSLVTQPVGEERGGGCVPHVAEATAALGDEFRAVGGRWCRDGRGELHDRGGGSSGLGRRAAADLR